MGLEVVDQPCWSDSCAEYRETRDWAAWLKWIQGFGRAGIALGYLTVIFSGWVKKENYLGNPLETDLQKYLRAPDYHQRVSFIEQFHEDSTRIIDAYAGDKTIYVFIDDLDRCEFRRLRS